MSVAPQVRGLAGALLLADFRARERDDMVCCAEAAPRAHCAGLSLSVAIRAPYFSHQWVWARASSWIVRSALGRPFGLPETPGAN